MTLLCVRLVARCLDRVAADDDLTVVLLRKAGGAFSTRADMNNAYGWYGALGAGDSLPWASAGKSAHVLPSARASFGPASVADR